MLTPLKTRQHILFVSSFVVLTAVLAAFLFLDNWEKQIGPVPTGKRNIVDDMSRMNAITVHQVWDIPENKSIAETSLSNLLRQAKAGHLHVSIAGARHSMGGQTIAPEGIRINMLPLKSMELDEKTDLLHVDAGARWADVIPYMG